jgi:hypothetical protein
MGSYKRAEFKAWVFHERATVDNHDAKLEQSHSFAFKAGDGRLNVKDGELGSFQKLARV